jgi:hypothetical protein
VNYKPVLIFVFCLLMLHTSAQPPIIEKIGALADKVTENMDDTTSQTNFIIYPTLAFTPETSWEFGVSSLYLFHARNDKRNRLSEINAFGFYTLKSQYGLWLDHALYSHKDKYFFLGKAKFQYFPLVYYGIGQTTHESDEIIISGHNIQIRERLLRKVKGHFFVGPQIDYHSLYNVKFTEGLLADSLKPLGSNGSSNLGVGLGVVYDTRHNVLNVRDGLFLELAYLNYGKYLGSTYNFQNVNFDARYFTKGFKKNQVWAFQVAGQFNFGDIPFNQLALLGGESLMRGYYMGRFRDKNMIASQVEYRFLPFPFSKRFGGAVFVGMGNVGESTKDLHLDKIKVAGGAGVRYNIFPSKDIFLRVDVAVTTKLSFPGIYFFIGEAF